MQPCMLPARRVHEKAVPPNGQTTKDPRSLKELLRLVSDGALLPLQGSEGGD